MKSLALLFLLTAVVAHAGPLDDLKQTTRDKAQGKAQQVADEAAAKAANQGTDDQNQAPSQPPPSETPSADQPPSTPPPATDSDVTPVTPPVEPAPASPDAASQPEGPPSPPPPGTFSIELRGGDPKGDNPPAAAVEFPLSLQQLFVRVVAKPGTTFNFFARVVAVEVPGLRAGIVVTLPDSSLSAVALWPESETGDLPLEMPRALMPGRYRVEIYEPDPPHRGVAQQLFTVVPAGAPGEAFNLADPEQGGLLELVTGEKGAGYTWSPQLLVPGNGKPWTPPPVAGATGEGADKPEMPCEFVVSFYQRQPALVSSVEILSTLEENAPGEVEIWGSNQSATEGFTRLATGTTDRHPTQFAVPVPPTQVRFLKIRILSAQGDANTPVLTGVRIREGEAPGYVPLAKRFPDLALWRLQPKHAAQLGLFYLQASAVEFQNRQGCIGCHVQTQALVGMTIARKNEYVVSETARSTLVDYLLRSQYLAGNFARQPEHGDDADTTTDISTSLFAALGIAYAHDGALPDERLVKAARWLAGQQQEDGSVPTSDERLPVTQGAILQTSNALDVWGEALKAGEDPVLRKAVDHGLAFIEHAEVNTTQDAMFQLLAFVRHGNETQKKRVQPIAAGLLQQQQPDGGWKVEPDSPEGSTPFSTGEVLYALRMAGVSIGSPTFQRGVRWLVLEQKPDGSWKTPQCSSYFSSTMWPVIALVGAFTTKAEPAHITVLALPRPVPPPAPLPPPPATVALAGVNAATDNIEFILDCSGSMNNRLGKSDRINTAKNVLSGIIAKLPDSCHVGLRFYGHRYSSFSSKSNTDTELVVPIGPLNRPALLKAIDGAKAHGETPLVYSTLQAGDDLKKIGGGSIVLVTDGEESCGGDPRKGGLQLAALGVPVRLNIIGFTLTGRRITNDMIAFAQPTGGNYYTAADGLQLANALITATLPVANTEHTVPPAAPAVASVEAPPEDLPVEIFDATGRQVAATTTLSVATPDLEPGTYRVVLHDGAKAVMLDNVKLNSSETAELRYSPSDGTLQRVSGL